MTDNEKLYAAILNGENVTGTLDGDIREALVHGPTWSSNFNLARWNYYKQFSDFAEKASPEEFAAVAERLYNAVGEKLYNNIGEYRYGAYRDLFFKPVFFEALLKFFDDKKMRKQMTMQEIIDQNSVTLLEMCARYGWLKLPRIRDAIIEYSQKKNRTECTAFLLDFKNKNFDLAAERVKAEKKTERELNADPNSVTALKKLWSFKAKDNGELVITGYKGNSVVLVVPAEIGGARVTEIGDWALSPYAPRIKAPSRDFRRTITKITLPEGLRKIGESAFNGLVALEDVNIPSTVVSIGEYAFLDCNELKRFVIPEGVVNIDANAFAVHRGKSKLEYVRLPSTLKYFREDCKWWRVYLFHADSCPKLVVEVPRAPHVEEFCEHNKVTFRYYDAK